MPWGPYFESGDELKRARIQANWTQKDLAQKAGVHVQTVKYHERRKDQLDGIACSRFRKALATASTSLPDLPKRRAAPIAPCPMVETIPSKNGFKNHGKPEQVVSIRCEAITRNGSPCKAKAMPGRNRCKAHGGLSTGPKTDEGRKRVGEAQARRWDRFRLEKQSTKSN